MLVLRSRRKSLAMAVSAVAGTGMVPYAGAQSLPGQPIGSIWFADPKAANSIMTWDPATDPDAVFNKSTVPLAGRIGNVVSVNANSRVNQGGVSPLVAFNQTNNNYSQGSSGQGIYAPSYWQYMNDLVYWGGSAGSGSILPPTATVIDAGHRNGVKVLGNVFLAPVVYGGTMTEVNAFLTQRPDGSYPVADKMILAVKTYGFDAGS